MKDQIDIPKNTVGSIKNGLELFENYENNQFVFNFFISNKYSKASNGKNKLVG